MKKWGLKPFIIRTIVCFLLIGGAVLYISYQKSQQVPVPTTQDKRIETMGLLTENYLRSTSLAGFSQSEPVSADTLTRLVKELENNTGALQLAAGGAGLDKDMAQKITAISAIQSDTRTKYRLANSLLAKAITYDPSRDLALLDPTKDGPEIATRAGAAATGLERILTSSTEVAPSQLGVGNVDGPQSIISASFRQAVGAQATCMRGISEIAPSAPSRTKSAIQSCADRYPALRREAIQNVLSYSYNESYVGQLDELVPTLKRQLETASS